MYIDNLGEIKAVAFDIDGTLYRTWKLNVRMSLHFLRFNQFFLKYGLVRNDMHRREDTPNFTQVQAELMAKRLKVEPHIAKERLHKIVYGGLEKYFKKIKPCAGVVELIKDLKAAGYKIAILSDFPPEQKGDIWGIREYCDVILGSEAAGALKPAELPFRTLAEKLELPPEEILYVGNSHKYDIVGAKKVSMKAAWFVLPGPRWFAKKSHIADITFSHYEQLRKIIFNNTSERKSD